MLSGNSSKETNSNVKMPVVFIGLMGYFAQSMIHGRADKGNSLLHICHLLIDSLHRPISYMAYGMLNREHRLTTVQNKCRGMRCASTLSGIECKIASCQQQIPVHLMRHSKVTQHLLQSPVHTLTLAISVQVICSTQSWVIAQLFHQCALEF